MDKFQKAMFRIHRFFYELHALHVKECHSLLRLIQQQV